MREPPCHALQEVGVTWVVIPGPEDAYPATRTFIETCAERYLNQ